MPGSLGKWSWRIQKLCDCWSLIVPKVTCTLYCGGRYKSQSCVLSNGFSLRNFTTPPRREVQCRHVDGQAYQLIIASNCVNCYVHAAFEDSCVDLLSRQLFMPISLLNDSLLVKAYPNVWSSKICHHAFTPKNMLDREPTTAKSQIGSPFEARVNCRWPASGAPQKCC